MLHYDKILTSLGEFGTYQKRLCVFMFIMTIPNGLHLTATVFNNITPDFRCAVPGLSNDSYTIQDLHHKSLVQESIPAGEDGEPYSHCKAYSLLDSTFLNGSHSISDHHENGSTTPCDGWVYDDKDGIVSQIVDFNLVCDGAMYKAHGNLMLLVGMVVGSLVGGTLSDLIGRKTTLVVATVVQSFAAGLGAFAQSIYLVMTFRFLLTLTGTTAFMAVVVLLAETVGITKRSMATMSSMLGFTAGQFLLVLVQYFIRDWRIAQMVQSFPFLTFVVFWWLIQESPRWLLSKNRPEEAQAVISYIAKVNKVSLSPDMALMTDAAVMKPQVIYQDEKDVDDNATTSGSGQVRIWHLCSSWRVALRISILCLSWATINMVYYGLVLGVGDLIDGNIYINFVLQSFMGIIAHMACLFVLERTGRKKIFCSSMVMSGLATLGIGLINLANKDIHWLSVTLFCAGKLGVTIGFNLIYIITTELLPTKIRNSGLGFCSFVARITGIITPYIVSASLLIPGSFGEAFPLLIFGIFSLASGLSAMLLPETRNKELPETFDENENSTTKA